MSTTAGDIIRGAMRLLQVASTDTVLTADEMNEGLFVLNEMLDSWSSEQFLLYQVIRETFALTAGHNPHTWGTGGDFNSLRPVEIVAASISIGTTPNVDLPLQPVSYDAYEAIALKGLVTNYPREYYWDAGYPMGNVYLYPVPNGSSINFESYKPLTQFTDQSTVLSLPPGYQRALRFNLAVALAPEYQISASPDVVRIASATVQKLKSLNYKAPIAKIDPALVKMGTGGPRYNPYSDGY